jgi:Pyruvate/2-oxoacid:ferredoxin oxidoreductase delta subunit
MKTLKDTTLSFQLTQKTLEEALARKSKEVDSLAKTKNCKGCVICLEDLREKDG